MRNVSQNGINDGAYGGVTLTKGVGTFSLKHGGAVILSNIPLRQYGTSYHVEELSYDGFIVKASMAAQAKGAELITDGPYTQSYYYGALQADSAMEQHQAVTLENYGGAVLPSTGGAGTNLYTIGGLLLMAVAEILLYIHNPQRRREDVPSL